LEFSPSTAMILEYNSYVLDLSERFPHITRLDYFLRFVYMTSGPVSALTYLLPFAVDIPLPWAIFIQRILTTGMNILAVPVIFRIAGRRLKSGWASAFISAVPILFPYFSIKLAMDIAGPGMLFAALATDALDRKKFGQFSLFLCLMSMTHPVAAVCGLIWLAVLHFTSDSGTRAGLKKAFPLQTAITGISCFAVIIITSVNPENALGGTPYSSKAAILHHIVGGNFVFAAREIIEVSKEILLLFATFLFLPLIGWRYVVAIVADLLYYFFTQTTFHGDLPAVMFFMTAGAIEGLAAVSGRIRNMKLSEAFQITAASAMFLGAAYLSLSVEDQFGNRTVMALWGTTPFGYERTDHARAIEECLSTIPEGSACVAPQALAPFIKNAKKVWTIEMILEHEAAADADCLLMDKKRLLMKNLETDDMKYRIVQNSLHPLSGTFSPYYFLTEEGAFMEMISARLASWGVNGDMVNKIRVSSEPACNNDGLILILSGEK
ncbi:MAG: hypothetical protein FJ088_07225, partial [Deltaproteobacteria bacterium]|nr:hypothetical protein [Deltaproteobacteria bacterium]